MRAPGEAPRRLSRARTALFALLVVPSALVALWFLGGALLWWFDSSDLEDHTNSLCNQRFADDGGVRLLFLGDSFTAGDGSASERGYWEYLPRALASEGVDDVQVLSLAISGSTSGYQLDQLRCWVERSGQTIDAVTLVAGANDWGSLRFQREFLATHEPTSHPALLRSIYELPRGLLFGFHYPRRLVERLRTPADQQLLYGASDGGWVLEWSYFASHPAYGDWVRERQRRNLGELQRLAAAAGGRLIVGSYVISEGSQLSDIEGPWSRFLEPAQRREEYDRRGLISSDDWHLSDAGAEDYASLWARWFVESAPER